MEQPELRIVDVAVDEARVYVGKGVEVGDKDVEREEKMQCQEGGLGWRNKCQMCGMLLAASLLFAFTARMVIFGHRALLHDVK